MSLEILGYCFTGFLAVFAVVMAVLTVRDERRYRRDFAALEHRKEYVGRKYR